MSRSRLLAAAAEEFAQHGRKGARVQGIVERAGVNERMIYHHFGSKEGLYRAVLEHERSALAEAWGPSLQRAEEMEPLDGVRMVLGGLFDLMVERPQLVALLVHEWLSAGVFSLPSTRQLPARFRAIYERGRRQGVFVAETDFEMVYGTVLAALVGQAVFLPWYFETTVPGSDRSELREHVLDQLMHGITGRRSSGSAPPPRSRARREEEL